MSRSLRQIAFFALFAGALLLPAGSRAAGRTQPGAPAVHSAPASISSIVADLERLAQGEMAEQAVPGLAFALVANDRLVHAKGYGVKRLGGTDAVGAHTVFEVGSTTKAFTSALVGMLVDEGKLKWSDRVVDRFPGFRLWDPWATSEFRVDDLMAQRSGMPGYSLDDMAFLGWAPQDIAEAVAFVEPVYSARSEFSYVNTLWLHAGFLIEQCGGISWRDSMARRILGPLGMTESTVDPDVVPLLDDVATGHMAIGGGLRWPIPADWPYRGWLDTYGPAGSLRSNVVDMSKWARLHLGNGTFEGHTLLSPATVSYLHASRTTMFSNGPSTTSYALGWANDTRGSGPVFWHNGGTYGMHAMVALYPSVNVGLVVLTNTDPNSIPEKMVTRLYELLFPGTPPPATAEAAATAVTAAAETDLTAAAAMLQPPAQGRLPKSAVPRNVGEPPDPAGEAAPLPLSRYTGSYRNPAFGRVTVQERSGALVLTIGPKRIEMPMEQFAGSFFALTLPDWPQWVTSVRFVVPSGGHATRFQVEKFSYASGGWFEWMAP